MMPEFPNPSVDIGQVEAEITGATQEVSQAVGRGQAPSAEQLARQIRETMAREAWRSARLSAD